jgi:hypothetical protein
MAELKNKVLEKIKEDGIEPKPRWQILLREYVVWFAFGFAVIIGAVSFCIILGVFLDNDWDVYKYAGDSSLQRIILSLPFFWFSFLFAFWIIAFYNYKHTRSGYKFSALRILGLSVAASVVLGTLFNVAFGAGDKIEVLLAEHVPMYEKINVHCNNKEIWLQPEKGLLAGRIVRITDAKGFDLEDFDGFFWRVEEGNNIFIRAKIPLAEKEQVKIIGEKEQDGLFHALEIREWKKGCTLSKNHKED